MEVTSSMAQTETLRPLRHHGFVQSTQENCTMSELGNLQAQPKAPLGTPALLPPGPAPRALLCHLHLPEPFQGAAAQCCSHCTKPEPPLPWPQLPAPKAWISSAPGAEFSTATSVLRAGCWLVTALLQTGLSFQLAPFPPQTDAAPISGADLFSRSLAH